MTDIEKKLNIPLCEPQRIPLRTLITQLQPGSADKRLLETHIGSIYLVGLLNEQTIRIRHYKDDDYSFFAIYVLKVILKKGDSVNAVNTLIHSAFPESTLIIDEYGSKKWISAATKRINKIDSSKTVIEDEVTAELKANGEKYLDLSRLRASDLREYNSEINLLVYKLKVLNATGIFPVKPADYKTIMKEYDQLISKKNQLEEEYKAATMMSEKMEIDDKIYDTEQDIQVLLQLLKEED